MIFSTGIKLEIATIGARGSVAQLLTQSQRRNPLFRRSLLCRLGCVKHLMHGVESILSNHRWPQGDNVNSTLRVSVPSFILQTNEVVRLLDRIDAVIPTTPALPHSLEPS